MIIWSALSLASFDASSFNFSKLSLSEPEGDPIWVQYEPKDKRTSSASEMFIDSDLLMACWCRSSFSLTENCFSFEPTLTPF